MGKFVLQLKHWQVFLLLTGLPCLVYLLLLTFIAPFPDIGLPADSSEYDSDWALRLIEGVLAITLIFSVLIFLWIRGMITGLYMLLESHESKPQKARLNLAFWFACGYTLIVTGGIYYWIIGLMQMEFNPMHNKVMRIMGIVFPMHILALIAVFYLMYQMAKMIRLAEGKPAQRFSDFAGEFFMIWFHPIGIWFLQPRLNALMEGNNEYDRHLEN